MVTDVMRADVVSAVLNIKMETVAYEENEDSVVWPLSQYGWRKGEPLFENCLEYKRGINVYELISLVKKYCASFNKDEVLSGFNSHINSYVVRYKGLTFYPEETELQAVMRVAGYLFDLQKPLKHSDIYIDRGQGTINLCVLRELMFRIKYYGQDNNCTMAFHTIHQQLFYGDKVSQEAFVEAVAKVLRYISRGDDYLRDKINFISDLEV